MRRMPSWHRPGEDGDSPHVVRYVAASALSAGGLAVLCAGVVSGELGGVWSLVIAAFMLGWVTLVWRHALVGVWVSDHGVKIRWPHRTRVIPWSQVERAWAGQAAEFDAWQVWVSTRDPEENLETPIWRQGRSATRYRSRVNRIVLPPEEFSRALAELNRTA